MVNAGCDPNDMEYEVGFSMINLYGSESVLGSIGWSQVCFHTVRTSLGIRRVCHTVLLGFKSDSGTASAGRVDLVATARITMSSIVANVGASFGF